MSNPEITLGVWYPISEAPKDGTLILGCSQKYDIPWFVIHWLYYPDPLREQAIKNGKDGCWIFSEELTKNNDNYPEDITHFQYLTIPKEYEVKP